MVVFTSLLLLLSPYPLAALIVGAIFVGWCTCSASRCYATTLNLQNKILLIGYPLLLFYSVFALLAIY